MRNRTLFDNNECGISTLAGSHKRNVFSFMVLNVVNRSALS